MTPQDDDQRNDQRNDQRDQQETLYPQETGVTPSETLYARDEPHAEDTGAASTDLPFDFPATFAE